MSRSYVVNRDPGSPSPTKIFVHDGKVTLEAILDNGGDEEPSVYAAEIPLVEFKRLYAAYHENGKARGEVIQFGLDGKATTLHFSGPNWGFGITLTPKEEEAIHRLPDEVYVDNQYTPVNFTSVSLKDNEVTLDAACDDSFFQDSVPFDSFRRAIADFNATGKAEIMDDREKIFQIVFSAGAIYFDFTRSGYAVAVAPSVVAKLGLKLPE